MRHRGRVIGAGDALYVVHDGVWVSFVISDFTTQPRAIYGRRIDGPYEQMSLGAVFDIPSHTFGMPKIARALFVGEVNRQRGR